MTYKTWSWLAFLIYIAVLYYVLINDMLGITEGTGLLEWFKVKMAMTIAHIYYDAKLQPIILTTCCTTHHLPFKIFFVFRKN